MKCERCKCPVDCKDEGLTMNGPVIIRWKQCLCCHVRDWEYADPSYYVSSRDPLRMFTYWEYKCLCCHGLK